MIKMENGGTEINHKVKPDLVSAVEHFTGVGSIEWDVSVTADVNQIVFNFKQDDMGNVWTICGFQIPEEIAPLLVIREHVSEEYGNDEPSWLMKSQFKAEIAKLGYEVSLRRLEMHVDPNGVYSNPDRVEVYCCGRDVAGNVMRLLGDYKKIQRCVQKAFKNVFKK
jgi:hypothetical protein